MIRRGLLGAAASAVLAGCGSIGRPAPSSPPAAPPTPSPVPSLHPAGPDLPGPPAAPREWRAAWVASVAHIDWPPRAGMAPNDQREAAQTLVDRARAIGLNALILQVRPAGDALYASSLEPWSEYLTGAQGQAPQPPWDPLQFWADACHRQGLELHAWINPYRARHPSARSPGAAPHLSQTDPSAVKSYGDLQWMDPGARAAQQRTLAVAADLARRYDIDGLHIDDYFYPYPVRQPDGSDLPFPDDDSYSAAGAEAAAVPRADWRREQVDRLVKALNEGVHQARDAARFGVSPFGLMRPDLRPPGITGFNPFDRLYAHVERWLREGWMDYVVPQLYWKRSSEGQAFEPLLDTWLALTPPGVALRAGLFSSRVGAERDAWEPQEIIEQILAVRRRPAADGHVHFSLSALADNRAGLADALRAGPYAQAALAPEWRPRVPGAATVPSGTPPPAPRPGAVSLRATAAGLVIDGPGRPLEAEAFVLAVWRRRDGRWLFSVQPAHDRRLAIDADTDAVALSAVDRLGREGPRQTWTIR